MSVVLIRQALETRLNTMTPALATAWEGVSFTPVTGTPYQQVNLLMATAENPTMGGTMYRQSGVFQVLLCYPPSNGAKPAGTRAELIRDHFKRGTTLTSGSVEVLIEYTPSVMPAIIDGERYRLPVSIRWSADIYP